VVKNIDIDDGSSETSAAIKEEVRIHLGKRERYMARKEKGIDMRKIINKVFDYINNSKNKSDVFSAVECKNATVSETETHYKWWGDDRYEPI
jgi:hypothetical protein